MIVRMTLAVGMIVLMGMVMRVVVCMTVVMGMIMVVVMPPLLPGLQNDRLFSRKSASAAIAHGFLV